MTTKMIRVDASYEDKLTSFIHENSEHMEIIDDAYFHERKKQLDTTMQAIDDGTMKMYSEDEFKTKMKSLEEKLTQQYAD